MHALVVEQLRKVYRSGFEALKGVDLTVEEGDFFALLGPNGAGKSTLIGIVTSLVNKTSGRVAVFGHDLDTEPEAVKASLGVVPQEFNFNLFLPVAEVVINQAGYFGIPRQEARERAEFYLRKLDLWGRRRSEMRLLSGGMKRRLMIARALVHRPRLLILDEPTAGVDIEIRRAMWDYLRELNAEGTTIILTTHYLEEAESLCRNIAMIDQGRIAAVAETQTLLAGLDTETFVLNLTAPLSAPPALPGFALTLLDATTLEAQLERGQSLNRLFAALGDAGIAVQSMRNKQNRLEQLFLEMVERGRGGTAARAA
ncbi:ABC transporter ATP-binding protein [uncultured Thiohalocapsa sp.]|uniref:ABC transporter ATP-binding protein n=1 Tax=uncultured Thiohalocapsa sp. TaxID=768990 RepID=UPI0025EF2A1F|nr:ABC transporter ATP-binding protein [uncultured Thiohalocapsa sp.]